MSVSDLFFAERFAATKPPLIHSPIIPGAKNAGHSIEYAIKVNKTLQEAIQGVSSGKIRAAIYNALDDMAEKISNGVF